MKTVLIIAYYFPPSGGPGGQRVLKHVRYLPAFGYKPIVLTVSNGQFPAIDESLFKEIPEGTPIHRTAIYEPYDLYRFFTGKKPGAAIDINTIKKEGTKTAFKERLAEFVRATFFIPDARMLWQLTARKEIKSICHNYDVSAVVSSSPPYTCSLLARYAKRKFGLPWIAEFRDPWTGFISSPNRWFIPKAIDKHIEHSVFNEADIVEYAWKGIMKDAFNKYPNLDEEKFVHIPNGFDSNDFPKIDIKKNDKFTLTYTGSLYGRRNPASLFAAIEQLIANGKINPNDFVLRFVGRFGVEVEQMMHNTSFRTSIESISYIPHDESIKQLMQSDALLLIVDESKESEEIVPGKVYEYIGVRKPIIAIAPHNSAIAELMIETQAGKTAHQSEIDKTCDIFLELFTNWKSGKTAFRPNQTAINKYERREGAKKLAGLLDKIIKTKK